MTAAELQTALTGSAKFEILIRGKSDTLAIAPGAKFTIAGNVLVIPQEEANRAFESITVNIEDIVLIYKRRQ